MTGNKKDDTNVPKYNCKECDFIGFTEVNLTNHMKLIHINNTFVGEEFNCMECDFQGHNEIQLRKHSNLKQKKKEDH